MEQVNKPQNALMHQKMQTRLLNGMIVLYANTVFDDLEEQSTEQGQERIQGFIYNSERLLGTEKGMLQQTIMKIFEETGSNKE